MITPLPGMVQATGKRVLVQAAEHRQEVTLETPLHTVLAML